MFGGLRFSNLWSEASCARGARRFWRTPRSIAPLHSKSDGVLRVLVVFAVFEKTIGNSI